MDVVSFFAGCGGLDLGFEQAGFRVVWANEFDPHCRATYIRNHPYTEFVLGDICKIDPHSIPDCDGFIGGPPCQSWSVAGRRKGLEDERGQLFLTYIEIIKAKKPKFFLIENVKGLLDGMFKYVFIMFLDKLKEAGYDVKWELLDAVNFGVPQNRERVFIVGFRKELNVNFEFPTATCFEPNTLIQAIGDIEERPAYYMGKEQVAQNPNRANHDVINSGFNPFYFRGNRRRGWHQPSFTINATPDFAPLHPSSPKMLCYGHEKWSFQRDKLNEYRRLSVRECARIQTFPDDFIFEYEDIRNAYKMIGNAVPPRLAQVVAKAILTSLENLKFKKSIEVVAKKNFSEPCILVGYYKNDKHHDLIVQNLLYYVRSDGRKGTVFKEDCSVMPEYLLLHHKDKTEIYELVAEEPVLADASFLRSLGFETSGKTYLCFRLKNAIQKSSQDLGGLAINPAFDSGNYSPYFTTIDKIIDLRI